MQIAILGAGFAGLALCWHLLEQEDVKGRITLFDPLEIGCGTSGMSSGLLHPYAGRHAKRSWMASEGMASTIQLLKAASIIPCSRGIFRPPQSSTQLEDFRLASQKYDDLEWWDQKTCEKMVPGMQAQAGLFVTSGITINPTKYLQGLWNACSARGAQIEYRAIQSLQELHSFDVIVVAAGAATGRIPELTQLPLSYIKGQTIELAWPSQIAPPPISMIATAYLAMQPEKASCLVGATYERSFANDLPDPAIAVPELKQKAAVLFPELSDAPVTSCNAGIRVFSPDKLTPIAGRVKTTGASSVWVFTGLGSKGLLYHGWLAGQLSQAIAKNDPSILPRELRWRLE